MAGKGSFLDKVKMFASEILHTNVISETDIHKVFKNISSQRVDGVTLMQVHVTPIHRNEAMKVRSCVLGYSQVHEMKALKIDKEITLMFVGETGSGKSTMIQMLFNQQMKIKYDDEVRLSIVDEPRMREKAQTESQTEWVTLYKLCLTKDRTHCPLVINLIDTPGFADTAGGGRDAFILLQIQELFQNAPAYGFSFLNAVCCTIRATETRFTPCQQYIANQIMTVFHKDIVRRICAIVTYSDGTENPKGKIPTAVQVLTKAGFHISDTFLFNNKDDLFRTSPANVHLSERTILNRFWKNNEKNCKGIIELARKNDGTTLRSIDIHASVILERKLLQTTYARILEKVERLIRNQSDLERCTSQFYDHQQTAERCKSYETFEWQKSTNVQGISSRGVAINCEKCLRTCHYPCAELLLNDGESDNRNCLQKCIMMAQGVICTACRCNFSVHYISNRFIENTDTIKIRTDARKKEEYEAAKDSMEKAGTQMCRMEDDTRRQKEELATIIAEARGINARLCEVALKPPCDGQTYLRLLIDDYSHGGDGLQERQERVRILRSIERDRQLLGMITADCLPATVVTSTLQKVLRPEPDNE